MKHKTLKKGRVTKTF